ncbi:hypothetical protein [Spiroplasma endosymbiont of Panorpa germanica]|uniref:hypothetical protein n=1 Tax=Spiroplasma endosymbiont of Panorpa germanica TaxID=3066314 RepID=UPI0030CB0B2A
MKYDKKLSIAFAVILALSLLFSLLITILFIIMSFDSVFLEDIPNVESDYFNGFVNQDGRGTKLTTFTAGSMLFSFGKLPITDFELIGYITVLPLLVINSIQFIWIKDIKQNKITEKHILFFGSITFILITNILVQLILFLNPNIIEVTFRKIIFGNYEKNYLIKNVGAEQLEEQIANAVKGLESIYDHKYQTFVIIMLTIGFLTLLIIVLILIYKIFFLDEQDDD